MRGTCVGAGSSRPGGREATAVAVAAGATRSTTATPVVIAGAGIVGASTAWFLRTEHDRPVLLFDATHPAASASGKAGGFLAETWSDGTASQELSRKGFSLHQTWSKQPEFAGVDYRFGIDSVSGALGEVSDYRFIGNDRRACGQVHPRKLTSALVDGIVARGGVVRSNTMLYEVLTEDAGSSGRKVVGVRVGNEAGGGNEEVIETDTCVLSLGAWTSVTVKSACGGAVVGPEIVGQKVHSVVVRDARVAERQASTSLFLHDERGGEPEAYPRPDGTLYVCGNQGGRSYDAFPPRLASEVGVEEDGSCEYLREVSAVVLETDARDVEVLEAQACYLPVSSSSRPVVSAVPGVIGLYINAGHACWGILQGPVSGKACAELIATGSSTCVDLRPFTL